MKAAKTARMNIALLHAPINTGFDYRYTDADGRTAQERINIKVKRLTYEESCSKEFRSMLTSEDRTATAKILAGLVQEWNLDADGEPFPPSAENISLCPDNFVQQLSDRVLTVLSPPQPAETKPTRKKGD